MGDVRVTGLAKLSGMRVLGEGERALDQRDVRGRQIVTKMSGEFGDFRHAWSRCGGVQLAQRLGFQQHFDPDLACGDFPRSEEHTSELQSPDHLVCRLLLEKKK